MFVCICVGGWGGGVLCVEVDKALYVSVHLTMLVCIFQG